MVIPREKKRQGGLDALEDKAGGRGVQGRFGGTGSPLALVGEQVGGNGFVHVPSLTRDGRVGNLDNLT